MSFYRNHIVPVLHNAVGGILGTAALAAVGILVASWTPMWPAVQGFLTTSVPLWIVMVLLVGATAGALVLRRPRSEQAMANEESPDSELQTYREEMKRQAKDLKEQADVSRQDRAYILALETRLNEKGLTLPRRPPPSPPQIIPNSPH